ncbi:MAG: fatty acid desaturase [Hyphomicrobium sp.]|uniref:fatty acid desaturase n=1 Tax=Hyphomicrobium sp. TaxID=82 RepID=UPI0039E55773
MSKISLLRAMLTAFASIMAGYFVLAAGMLYWLVAGAGALGAKIVPRSVIKRHPLGWLIATTVLTSVISQSVPGFFPDYSNPRDILIEISFWLSLGLLARAYLFYTECAETFDGLKASIAERPIERWLASVLHHPVDAIFTRIWVANSILMAPMTVLLILPSTINYFVIMAYATTLLLGQFPQEIVEHQNIHTRVFAPKIGASPRIKMLLGVLQFYFEYVFALLTSRVPGFYRVQHVYVHHTEDNGPLDTQTTLPYDRTSFFDFSLHAFWQSVDLVSGCLLLQYLIKKGKKRQIREVIRGLVIWYAFVFAVAIFNPAAAVYLFISRFLGGPFITLITFYQHGLVDPNDPHEVHGHTIDFVDAEHGNLGFDYHVEHHQKPARHWSHYYEQYLKSAGEEGGHKAIVMQKEQFGPLALMAALWRKDYVAIARHAHIHDVPDDDLQALTRIVDERTLPLGSEARAGTSATADRVISRLMAAALPTSFAV